MQETAFACPVGVFPTKASKWAVSEYRNQHPAGRSDIRRGPNLRASLEPPVAQKGSSTQRWPAQRCTAKPRSRQLGRRPLPAGGRSALPTHRKRKVLRPPFREPSKAKIGFACLTPPPMERYTNGNRNLKGRASSCQLTEARRCRCELNSASEVRAGDQAAAVNGGIMTPALNKSL